jgi:hypothetical protein
MSNPTEPIAKTFISTATGVSNPTSTPIITTVSVTPSPNIIEFKNRWLSKNPCGSPCWEGITLGKTPIQEAINLLKQNPLVLGSSINIYNRPLSVADHNLNTVSWKTNDGSLQYSDLRYDISMSPAIVMEINPSLLGAELGDIIRAYGEPEYINASISGGYGIGFYWFSKGIAGGLTLTENDKSRIINSDTTIKHIRFFTPVTPEKYIANTIIPPNEFVKWEGYQNFLYYCALTKQICKKLSQ